MAKVSTIQTNFTAGELSPKVRGRMDIARYQNGAEEMQNVLVNVYGGAERTPGTEYLVSAKIDERPARLVTFVFNRAAAYHLEFGDGYMRIVRAGAGQIVAGGVPYEIASPYSAEQAREFTFAQASDTMFIAHGDHPLHTLRRLAEDDWLLAPAPLTVAPFGEVGSSIGLSMTLSDATVGTGRTATSIDVFFPSDVGRRISWNSGSAIIRSFISSSQVTIDILSRFQSVDVPAGWVLEDSPQAPLKPSAKGTVGQEITLSFSDEVIPGVPQERKDIDFASSLFGGSVEITVPGHGYSNGDRIRIEAMVPSDYNGEYIISFVTTDTFQYPLAGAGAAEAYGTARRIPNSSVSTMYGWRAADVGKYVRINRGLVLITAVDSSNSARGIVKKDLDSDVLAPASAWTLEGAVWGGDMGYPRAVTLNEQRLVVGGTRRYPQGIWATLTGLYYDFTPGDNDGDGLFFNVYSEQVNLIEHLASSQAIIPLTYGGEFTIKGGVEKPLSPTNVQVKSQSVYGCSPVRPVRIGNEIMFVQRSGRKVRALSYRVESDSYGAPDLTVLAEHLTQGGIVAMAYQQDPQPILWCVRADGRMLTLTIDRDEGVIAWTSQYTDGAFEDVSVAPAGDTDEVLVLVRRSINGQTRRYLERFAPAYCVQAGISGTSEAGATVWAGLSHLEGKSVDVLADGVPMDRLTVAGGQIVLPREAFRVQIGLPYTPRVKLLRPEVGTQTGTSQGSQMRTHKINVLMLDTVGAWINNQEVQFKRFGSDLLDEAPNPYSGYKAVGETGWESSESDIVIEQREPLPFHILAVVRQWTVNNG